MNIYDYFNSPDIAAHCASLNKQFKPWEKQVLIAMSHRPARERLAAYRALLPEAENAFVPENDRFDSLDLHQYLLNMLDYEEEKMRIFYRGHPRDGFYRGKAEEVYRPYVRSDCLAEYCSQPYRTYGQALRDLQDIYQDDPGSSKHHYSIIYEQIDTDFCYEADLELDGTLLRLMSHHPDEDKLGEQALMRRRGYVDLPTPFKKGDLLEAYNGFLKTTTLYLIEGFCYEDKETHQRLLMHGDGTDMTFSAYVLDGAHSHFDSHCQNYDLLRYIRNQR